MRWIVAFVLSLFVSYANAAGWTFKQANNNDAGSGTSIATSFTSAFTSGDIVVGWVEWSPNQAGDPISSISDGTHTYTVINFLNDATQSEGIAMFWSNGTLATSATLTITVNFGATSMTFSNAIIAEFTPPTGTTAVATDTTGSTLFTTNVANAGGFNSGNFTTTNDGDLIFGVGANNVGVSTAGTGFTSITTSSGNNLAEYEVQTTHGSINAAFVNNAGGVAEVNADGVAIHATLSSTCLLSLALLGVGC